MSGAQVRVGVDDPIWRDDSPAEATAPPPHRRLLIAGLVGLVAVVACYCAVAAGLSRQDYGNLAFWQTPRRINYCGRRYFPAGSVTGNPGSFTSEVDPSSEPRWQTVGHTFSLRPIQAPVLRRRGASSVCAMTMYVPVVGSRFAAYSLSGGP